MAEPPSTLMLDECFRAEDDRFLDLLKQFHRYAFLRSFADRWAADTRTWSRAQVVGYLQTDLNLPGHEVLVKRLFKHHEAEQDWEILPHFLVAFDRLVRRKRMKRYRYDSQSHRSWTEEALYAKPNKTVVDELGENNNNCANRSFVSKPTSALANNLKQLTNQRRRRR